MQEPVVVAPKILVFIDENMPTSSIREIFESHGHEVQTVGMAFPAGSPDRAILAAANRAEAVVISADDDWRILIGNKESGQSQYRFRKAGRILMNCSHVVAIKRLSYLLETIKREYLISQIEGKRLIMSITEGNFRVER